MAYSYSFGGHQLRWSKNKPAANGFYWLAEAGMKPHIVEINQVDDSHDKRYVSLPGDNEQYPLSIYDDALWLGPLPDPE